MAARFNGKRFQRKPKDWLWVPQVQNSYTQGTTPLFSALVLPVDWQVGAGTSKDRGTYYGTKGHITIGPPGASATTFLAIGKDISSTFDPAVSGDYSDEGDIFWSYIVRWSSVSTEPITIEVNIKARRILQTAGEDAVELVTQGSGAGSGNIAFSLHSLMNRA